MDYKLLTDFTLISTFLFLFFLTSTTAFNLEPRVAIVKEGKPGSFFGFSVAQHQIQQSNKIESTLLVGAPLDGLSNLQPGALWKCPLTSRPDDCSRVLADPLQ